jgi:dephospho-CoA kinase
LKIIGLTGGIASGKSSVAKMFEKLGAAVIDADQVSREVSAPGGPAIGPIRAAFGDSVIDPSGALDREAMRQIVFDDRKKLDTLELILHPLIYQQIGNRLFMQKEAGTPVAIIEATLLIEAPPPVPPEALIVVACDVETRIQRVKQRDGFDEAHIRQVLANQSTDEERIKHADYVIQNDGSLEETVKRVEEVWSELNA